jgi:phosphonate transport system substrate-binding protein
MEDMADSTFAFTTTASSSGFLYPMYHLINMYGLSRDEILTPGILFSEVTFSGGNNPSIVGVAHNDFDVVAVGHIQFYNAINAGLISEEDVRVIGYTENIPFPGYIARVDLPEELRRQIQEFLVNWDSDTYSGARFRGDTEVRYVMPDENEIDHLRSMVEILDIDLEEQE